jgi:hypothetical protein
MAGGLIALWSNVVHMEVIDFLPVVKAYPVLSRSYGEVSCIAGIQLNAPALQWVRLYPVPFRALEDSQQFAKYQPMRLRGSAHSAETQSNWPAACCRPIAAGWRGGVSSNR